MRRWDAPLDTFPKNGRPRITVVELRLQAMTQSIFPLTSLALFIACLGACSSAPPVTGPQSSAATSDAGGSADAGNPETTPGSEEPMAPGPTYFANGFDGESCEAICNRYSDFRIACVDTHKCTGDFGAGVGQVSRKGNTKEELTSCKAVPGAGSAEVLSVTCCCSSPYTFVKGKNKASCADVCSAEGLRCTGKAPFNNAGSVEAAGGLATFTSSTGSTTYGTLGCDGPPPASKRVQSKDFMLDSYTCGCEALTP